MQKPAFSNCIVGSQSKLPANAAHEEGAADLQQLGASRNQYCLSKRRINSIEALILRSLPLEITTEIFRHCIPPFRCYDPEDDTSVLFKLGAVCHLWRSIIWASPLLWSSVTLMLCDLEHQGKASLQTSLLAEWLPRSGSRPLSIRLCLPEAPIDNTVLGTICVTINAYSARWYEIDFRFPAWTYQYLPSHTLLPLLRSCQFNQPRDFVGERSDVISFSNTPRLRHLVLDCTGIYPRSLTFQWALLSELEITGVFIDECLHMLIQSPNLVSLSVGHFLVGEDEYPMPTKPVEHHLLENITLIDDHDSPYLGPLFTNVVFYKSKTLSFSGLGRGRFPSGEFVSLQERSGCPLTNLSLSHTSITEEALIFILPCLPALTFFSVTETPPFTDRIWESLNPRLRGSWPLPHLETLEYEGLLCFSWGVLLETLNARSSLMHLQPSPTGEPLSYLKALLLTVTSETSSPMGPSIPMGFDQLQASGLELEITFKLPPQPSFESQ